MIYHFTWERYLSFPGLLPGGYLGVDVFFVLSGFLITSLLIGEWDKRDGAVSFRNFYARRALRLFPALACVIVGALVLALALRQSGGYAQSTFSGLPWVIGYVGNWSEALRYGTLGALGHTWSLAVEEQFYLLWPALFVLLMRRRSRRGQLALLLALLAAAEMAARAVLAHAGANPSRLYFGTDSHSDGLLLGAAVAFWLSSGHAARLTPAAHQLLRAGTWLGTTLLAILFVFGNLTAAPWQISAAVLASGMIMTGLVAGDHPAALNRLLSAKAAVWIGRRSYGLYLWHYVVFAAAWTGYGHYLRSHPAARTTTQHLIYTALFGAAAIASFIIAAISYRFIERPILRLKRRFYGGRASGHHRKQPSVVA